MRFTSLIFAAGLAAAAPTANTVSAMAAVPQWSIENMKRVCDAKDTSCTWSFGINNNQPGSHVVPCTFTINAANGKPASQTDGAGFKCEIFTVSEGWSGQFGAGNGFTTLSVANFNTRRIAYPAYTDKELADGKVVSPNKSYQPQNF